MQKESAIEADIRQNKIKQGFLVKRSRILKQWKMRWMVLTRSHLYSFENQGIYRNATQKIPLREISTIKSYYKTQYQRGQVFRIESDDTSFYISAQNHQEKWSWMTAIQKMVQLVANPNAQDSQNLIRQTLRMSTAVRQSSLIPRKSSFGQSTGEFPNVMRRLKFKHQSKIMNLTIQPKIKKQKPLKIQNIQSIAWNQNNKQVKIQQNKSIPQQKVVERIIQIQKIIEVKVPIEVEKIIQRQRIIYIRSDQQSSGGNLSDLFAALINCKLDDPKPLLDFVSFLGLSGIQRYQSVALQFCCQRDSHRFFSELILQALNQEVLQERLNRYAAFIYILCERDYDFFYTSDLKILAQIVVRQLQLYRSDLNQMINLQLLKVLLTYHIKILGYKRNQIHAIAAQIANLGPHQNRELAQEICVLIN